MAERNTAGVVGAGVCVVRGTLTPALSPRERVRDRGLALLADIPDRQRRDGPPERVVRGEDAVIPVPVLPRRRSHG